MLKAIAEKLQSKGLVSASVWVEKMQTQGELVKLYREYYEGQHRLKLTEDMKRMMQIHDNRLDRYNVNYSEMVVNALTDRLKVDRVEAQTAGDPGGLEMYLAGILPDGADVATIAGDLVQAFGMSETGESESQLWADDVLADNRFDAMQLAIRQALVIDGDTFVMSQWSDEESRIILAHEKAWDGQSGVMVVYDRTQTNIVAGVKVWWEKGAQRVNIYHGNTVDKYSVETDDEKNTTALASLGKPDNVDTDNALKEGVPIVHFKGRSALVNVIPLQDSLNQTLLSMVMSALLAGFPFLISMGVRIPNAQTPGMIIDIMTSAVQAAADSQDKELIAAVAGLMNAIKVERIEGGSLDQFIKQSEYLINQIGTITHTPLPGQMGGDSQSGEALKQREVGLLGRAETLQVLMGNAYEDMLTLAHNQQTIYAVNHPPKIKRFNTVWRDAQIRNEADILSEAEWYHDRGYEAEALRVMGKTARQIEKLMKERVEANQASMRASAGYVNGMNEFAPLVVN